MIRINDATVTYTADGAHTAYDDGSSYGAQPHATAHYDEIADRCGYLARATVATWPLDPSDDEEAAARLAYCREHEVFHHIVGGLFYGGRSPILWALAHGSEVTPEQAALEEAMVMTVQRWVRAGERPIIGGVEWDAVRANALALFEAAVVC
ncbi:hypothetical protein [Sphingomonas sp. 1P08PE]|uniref:hypothetical protein n=1 Tax=Sphingomonas sp. 1P08PE TaxID=554122 RepID=UPI0039A2FAC5